MNNSIKAKGRMKRHLPTVTFKCFIIPFLLLGACDAQPGRERSGQKITKADATPEIGDNASSVYAMVSREDALGATENDMDQDFLARVNQQSVIQMRMTTERSMKDRGAPFEPNDLTAESAFVVTGGKKLAVTRFKLREWNHAAQIIGLDGREMVRVVCVTNKSENIVITRGPCNDKIKEVFGVSFNPIK